MKSSEIPYRLEESEGYFILELLPELNKAQWAEFEKIGNEVLDRLEQQKPPAFLVDLSALNYMGSAMVALIVRLWKWINERDGQMVVVNRHELVLEVLRLAGLHNVWSIVETREEGVRQLGKATGPRSGTWTAICLVVVGLLALAGGGAGLYMLANPPHQLDDRTVLGLTFGCSAVGLIVGTIAAARQKGGRRAFGIFVVVAGLALIVAGVSQWPHIAN